MAITIKARFSKGVIIPLEKIEIPEGEEITVIILEAISKGKDFLEVLDTTFGAWKDTINCDELLKNIYADRFILTRPKD